MEKGSPARTYTENQHNPFERGSAMSTARCRHCPPSQRCASALSAPGCALAGAEQDKKNTSNRLTHSSSQRHGPRASMKRRHCVNKKKRKKKKSLRSPSIHSQRESFRPFTGLHGTLEGSTGRATVKRKRRMCFTGFHRIAWNTVRWWWQTAKRRTIQMNNNYFTGFLFVLPGSTEHGHFF